MYTLNINTHVCSRQAFLKIEHIQRVYELSILPSSASLSLFLLFDHTCRSCAFAERWMYLPRALAKMSISFSVNTVVLTLSKTNVSSTLFPNTSQVGQYSFITEKKPKSLIRDKKKIKAPSHLFLLFVSSLFAYS